MTNARREWPEEGSQAAAEGAAEEGMRGTSLTDSAIVLEEGMRGTSLTDSAIVLAGIPLDRLAAGDVDELLGTRSPMPTYRFESQASGVSAEPPEQPEEGGGGGEGELLPHTSLDEEWVRSGLTVRVRHAPPLPQTLQSRDAAPPPEAAPPREAEPPHQTPPNAEVEALGSAAEGAGVLHTLVLEEGDQGKVPEEDAAVGGGVAQRATAGGAGGRKQRKNRARGGKAGEEVAGMDPEGRRLARSRNIWAVKGNKEALEAEYGPRMQGLGQAGRQGVEDAIGMATPSKKHKCMHVMLQYLLALGTIVHCDEEGVECAFWGGGRVVVEPRAAMGQQRASCAFGGWRGFRVVEGRAEEFLSHWAGMHEMPISAVRAASPGLAHALGLSKRDWETLTENLSNQENKFGLVPLPGVNGGFGGQMSWTKAFRGETAFVFRRGAHQ